MEIPFYVGCYAPKGQDSLFAYCLNTQTGSVTQTHTCAEVENPSYLALSSDGETLYAVSETETFQGQAGGGFAALSCKNSFSVYGQSATRGTFPCHILLQEADGLAFISNYGSGSISTFLIKPAAAPRLERVPQHHGHGPNARKGRTFIPAHGWGNSWEPPTLALTALPCTMYTRASSPPLVRLLCPRAAGCAILFAMSTGQIRFMPRAS